MEYLVLIEQSDTSFGAFVPNLPGCIAVGDSREKVLKLIRGAIAMHLEGMVEDGQPLPIPDLEAVSVKVKVPKNAAFARGTDEKPSAFLSQSQAARELGVTPATVGNWKRAGKLLGTVELNQRTTLIPAAEVERVRKLLGTPEFPAATGKRGRGRLGKNAVAPKAILART